MSVIKRMKPVFAELDGGLFSAAQKADVGDVAARMEEQGVAMMSWADPFKPDPSTPPEVIEEAVRVIRSGTSSHYFMPIGQRELSGIFTRFPFDPLRPPAGAEPVADTKIIRFCL